VGLSISVTIVASLLVSLTVIPAISVFLARPGAEATEPRWVAAMRSRYVGVLRWTTLRRPRLTGWVIVPGVVALTIALCAVTKFKPDVESDEGIRQERLRVALRYPAPVDKRTSDRYTAVVEKYLESRRAELGIRDIYSFYGPDEAGISVFFERGELSADFLKRTREDLKKNLPVQAGVEYRFGDEEGRDSGAKQFALTVFGEDTELLGSIVAEAKRRLAAVHGVSDLASDLDTGQREIQVTVDRARASRHGIRAEEISQVLALTYRGMRLPRLNTGEKEIDLEIRLTPDDTESIENLASLTVGEENGRPVALDQVAELRFGQSPRSILRQNGKTGVVVRGSWDGERLDEGLDEVRAVMNGLQMPFGYSWNFGSEIQRAGERNSEMGANLLLALFCVFVVMATLFESLLAPAIVMGCVPFAFLGVVWLMLATSTPFNLMAFIGMVILIGVIVNNGIVLVDHVNARRRAGADLETAILEGCTERLRPILMTAGTTIVGLIPLAISDAHLVEAKYYPMARAIIGGMISGTLLTLLVLPTYLRLAQDWVADLRAALAHARTARRAAAAPGDI
jgi:HAE1 family hydrophobic/amphiphilic exporter-1